LWKAGPVVWKFSPQCLPTRVGPLLSRRLTGFTQVLQQKKFSCKVSGELLGNVPSRPSLVFFSPDPFFFLFDLLPGLHASPRFLVGSKLEIVAFPLSSNTFYLGYAL